MPVHKSRNSKKRKYTSKAGVIQSQDNISQGYDFNIISGSPCKSNDFNPVNLLSLNTGWINFCNTKNANTCSSIPLKLYYKNPGKTLEMTAYKSLSNSQVKSICKSANIILKEQEDIQEILEHPILTLFKNINDTMNYYDWCSLNFQYQGLIGNSYNEIIYDADGLPIALNPLLGEFITIKGTGKNQGKIISYLYKPDDKTEKTYKPEQVLHFANYAPSNNLIGRGELEFCYSAQERFLYMDAYEKYLSINNGRPDIAVAYKNRLSEKDLKDQYRQWNKKFGGVQNSGKVAVTSGDMTITNLGFAPKDMQFGNGRTWALKEICAAYSIPEALVSVTDVNRANSVEATNHYLRYCIYPKMTRFCSKLNEQLVPLYDPNLFIWMEEQYLENPVDKNKTTIELFNAGIIDKNEARSAVGYEPLDEEDMETEVDDSEEDNNEENSNEV